jgi:uncharacterized protein YtpQ (UPF0354 family)
MVMVMRAKPPQIASRILSPSILESRRTQVQGTVRVRVVLILFVMADEIGIAIITELP